MNSKYPLRDIGVGEERLWLSEEERESHVHVLGTTGEGKSKLIEHLVRGDILTGNGVCLLDPTDRAETAYNILRFCASIGFEKVCLIDPFTLHSHKRITCIQPFHFQKTYKNASVANIGDTIRTVFSVKDQADTARINRYLPAVLHCLWNAEMTVHEALYFTDHGSPAYRARRKEILSHSDPLDRHRLALEEVFESRAMFLNEFQSTARRFEPFFDSTLDLMFGADYGVPFMKMITEGWVILVNLYSGLGVEPIHTRLLGTTVINELIFALDRLRNRGWKGVHYLYVDEAGRYANRNLADLLAYKRKSGLRVTVAHQYFKQFDDPYVLEAVKNLCKLKFMFDTPSPHDRLEMIRMLGYGGEIPPEVAQYANQNLPKQYAVFKPAKGSPVRVKITNVPDVKISKQAEADFIRQCLLNDWNYHPAEVREQMKKRFYDPGTTRTHIQSPPPRKAPDRSPARPAPVPERVQPRDEQPRVPAGDEKPQAPRKRQPIKI
jgi:hypothetical protein